MTFSSKPLETLEGAPEVIQRPRTFSAIEIHEFAKLALAKKCEQFHEDPRPFVAFIINVSGELQLVALTTSNTEKVDPKKLASSKSKDQIIHRHPLVLARRAFIRYLVKEAKKHETNDPSSILIANEEGELQLQPSCHLYMYSTLSFVCENVIMGLEALKTHDTNHCIMNKVRRWNILGIQGALLSNIFAPVYISKIVYGTAPPVSTVDIWMHLFGNLKIKDREMTVDALPLDATRGVTDRTFVWFQGLNGLDVIAENGRLFTGDGSSVCKEEIFKAYLQLAKADKRILKYSRAKKQAGHYQLMKKLLYKKWESEKNGKWLKRKSNKADKFWVELRDSR